jgi:dienelactone hydrolase
LIVLLPGSLLADDGTVTFIPKAGESPPPEYRLDRHEFAYHLETAKELPIAGVSMCRVTFPSPVESPFAENNTVHCEYYRPKGAGPFPGVIVLDVLGGDQTLARSMARLLAQNQVAGLFVQMAYYGPRKPKGSNVRLLSTDLQQSVAAIRQTVLDCRRASAWLQSRSEINSERLGIVGTSLGSFMAALTGEFEPSLRKVAVLYGGGGFVDAYYEHPRARPYMDIFEKFGGTKNMLKHVIAPVDPLTHADKLKQRDLLIVAAKNDDIVPPIMAKRLWEASGKQKIVWFDATHYGAILYMTSTMREVLQHFRWEK